MAEKTNDEIIADLMQRVQVLEAEKKEADTIIRRYNEAKAQSDAMEIAKEEGIRQSIIEELAADGFWTKQVLEPKTMKELLAIKESRIRYRPRTIASIAADTIEAKRKKAEPLFTVGAWDPVEKKWKGGI